MSFTDLAWISWPLGLLAAGLAFAVALPLARRPAGNEAMRALAAEVEAGSLAWLRRVVTVAGIVAVVAALFLFLALGLASALAFLGGVLCALAALVLAATAAARAPLRAAEAARDEGQGAGARVAFSGAAPAGLAAVGLPLFGVGLAYFLLIYLQAAYLAEEFVRFSEVAASFALGVAGTALFARGCGAVFAGGAGLALTWHGGAEAGVPAEDPRNPLVEARGVAAAVGGAGGMAAEVMESLACAVAASAVVGAASPLFTSGGQRVAAVALPLLAGTAALLASAAGVAVVRARPRGSVPAALGAALAVFLLVVFLVVRGQGFDIEDPRTGRLFSGMGPFWALASGALVAAGWALAGWLYAGVRARRRVPEGPEPDADVARTLALGLESAVLPLLLLGVAAWLGYLNAGLYGIGLAAVGALAAAGTAATVHAYGAMVGTAETATRLTHLGSDARAAAHELEAGSGEGMAAARSLAVGSAGLAGLALFAAYYTAVHAGGMALTDPAVLLGLALGAAVPSLSAALVLAGAGRATRALAGEAERQLREVQGLREGAVDPQAARSVDVGTRAGLRTAAVPLALAVLVPLVVGRLLGAKALGGVLVGSVMAGVPLALLLVVSRAASPGGPALAADPAREGAGLTVNSVLKVMGVVALVASPWITTYWGVEEDVPDVLATAAAALRHAAAMLL